MMFTTSFAAMLLAATTNAAALPANNVARQDGPMCKVEASASHSYGGAGPGQVGIDNVAKGAVACYDVNNNVVYSTARKAESFDADTATISAADCHTQGDVTLKSTFNSASNGFDYCVATYNGVDTEGAKSSKIDSNIVSVSTGFCTIYIPC